MLSSVRKNIKRTNPRENIHAWKIEEKSSQTRNDRGQSQADRVEASGCGDDLMN